MVTSITSLSRSGLYDWMLQRLSALVLGIYSIFIFGYILCHPDIGYHEWRGLFANLLMKIFTLLFLLSLMAHAWVGMWTIATDYLNDRAFGSKAVFIRFPVQLVFFITLFCYLIWAVDILWGI